MKLFDTIKQSNRLLIADHQWVLDIPVAVYKASLNNPHIQFTKILRTAEDEQHFQCFVSDQDIEIKVDGSTDVAVFVVDTKTLLTQGKSAESKETFKFTFYREVPFQPAIEDCSVQDLIDRFEKIRQLAFSKAAQQEVSFLEVFEATWNLKVEGFSACAFGINPKEQTDHSVEGVSISVLDPHDPDKRISLFVPDQKIKISNNGTTSAHYYHRNETGRLEEKVNVGQFTFRHGTGELRQGHPFTTLDLIIQQRKQTQENVKNH
jgi:hypothetical protein